MKRMIGGRRWLEVPVAHLTLNSTYDKHHPTPIARGIYLKCLSARCVLDPVTD